MNNPEPSQVKQARKAAGLTQQKSADMLHTQIRVWQQWEYGERRMHPAFWELYRIKTKGFV